MYGRSAALCVCYLLALYSDTASVGLPIIISAVQACNNTEQVEMSVSCVPFISAYSDHFHNCSGGDLAYMLRLSHNPSDQTHAY